MIERLLKDNGAVLVSQNKHLKFRLSNGKTVILSKTPSDRRTQLNEISRLRRDLRD